MRKMRASGMEGTGIRSGASILSKLQSVLRLSLKFCEGAEIIEWRTSGRIRSESGILILRRQRGRTYHFDLKMRPSGENDSNLIASSQIKRVMSGEPHAKLPAGGMFNPSRCGERV
jgi:hypothetical protein